MTASVDDILACVSEKEFEKDYPQKEKPKTATGRLIWRAANEMADKMFEERRIELRREFEKELTAKEDSAKNHAAEDVKKLSELYKELIEKRRERRDSRAIFESKARNYSIANLIIGVIGFFILLALAIETGKNGSFWVLLCLTCPCASVYSIWQIQKVSDGPVFKRYFNSLDMEIWEIERKIREIERKYEVRSWLRR